MFWYHGASITFNIGSHPFSLLSYVHTFNEQDTAMFSHAK
jgi:hypothetical protein